jgi:hypothetical protein
MYPVKPDLLKGTEVLLNTGVEVAIFKNADDPEVDFVVSRWTLTEDEREDIRLGKDVFLVQSTNNKSTSPAFLVVGRTVFDDNMTVRQADGDPGPSNTVPTDSEGEEDPDRIRNTELL